MLAVLIPERWYGVRGRYGAAQKSHCLFDQGLLAPDLNISSVLEQHYGLPAADPQHAKAAILDSNARLSQIAQCGYQLVKGRCCICEALEGWEVVDINNEALACNHKGSL